jgi:predicted PurR-regulated permease PerM
MTGVTGAWQGMVDSKQGVQWWWWLILAGTIGLLYLSKSVLVPLTIAALLAYAFDPAVDFLEKRRVPRSLGVWLIFLIIVTVIFLFLLFVIPVIQEQIARAVERFPAYIEYIRDRFIPYLEETFGFTLPKTFQEISETVLPRLREQAPTVFQPVTGFLLTFFSNTAHFLHPFYIVLLFAAIQSVQGLVVAPLVMGHSVGLHPLVVIVAIYVGGDLFGFIGVLLAVPMAAILVVLIKTLAEHYRNSMLYRGSAEIIEPGGPGDPPL